MYSTGGTLYFSNNFRGFEMAEEIEAYFDVEEISHWTVGPDFKRNQKIHRAWRIKHPAIEANNDPFDDGFDDDF